MIEIIDVINEQPYLQLSWYTYGLMLTHRVDNEVREHPVDPKQVTKLMSEQVTFKTGLITTDMVFFAQKGQQRIIAEYRQPTKTGIWLEGSEAPLIVPMPGLMLVAKDNHYIMFAMKRRPLSPKDVLFNAPLPNTYSNGNVCWGSVKPGLPEEFSLEPVWRSLLGSPFGNHSVGGKSKKHKDDIRKQLLALHDKKAKAYPVRDLIPTDLTVGKLFNLEV